MRDVATKLLAKEITVLVSAASRHDFCSGVSAGASMVKRPASALDNPVRESPSSTSSQHAKVILNTRANGVSAGEVRSGLGESDWLEVVLLVHVVLCCVLLLI